MAAQTYTTARGSLVDLVRRRRGIDASSSPLVEASTDSSRLGAISRRYGLMTCEEAVDVREVIATSGDLAVADRLAFIAAVERRIALVVIATDTGEYHACVVDAPLDQASLADFVPAPGAPRVMSLVSERGITPALGPLACA